MKESIKNILSIVIALFLAYLLLKLLFLLLGFVLKALGYVLLMLLVAIIAIPIYYVLKKKVF